MFDLAGYKYMLRLASYNVFYFNFSKYTHVCILKEYYDKLCSLLMQQS